MHSHCRRLHTRLSATALFAPLSPSLSRRWHCVSHEHCLIHGSFVQIIQMPTLAVWIREHTAKQLSWWGLWHPQGSHEKPGLERLSPGKLLSV